MKPLLRLVLLVASLITVPALLFVGPAAAAKGGNAATVLQCKERVAAGAFSNLGQCVSAANHVRAPGAPEASVIVRNEAALESDGSVVLTIDYLCVPGSGNDTVGTLMTKVDQPNSSFGSPTTVQARCDGHLHVGVTDNTNPPGNQYLDGQATAFANVANSDGDGAGFGGPITITG